MLRSVEEANEDMSVDPATVRIRSHGEEHMWKSEGLNAEYPCYRGKRSKSDYCTARDISTKDANTIINHKLSSNAYQSQEEDGRKTNKRYMRK